MLRNKLAGLAAMKLTISLCLAASCVQILSSNAADSKPGLRFEVSVSEKINANPGDGRLLILLARDNKIQPRLAQPQRSPRPTGNRPRRHQPRARQACNRRPDCLHLAGNQFLGHSKRRIFRPGIVRRQPRSPPTECSRKPLQQSPKAPHRSRRKQNCGPRTDRTNSRGKVAQGNGLREIHPVRIRPAIEVLSPPYLPSCRNRPAS